MRLIKRCERQRVSAEAGFTLIELLLVVIIIAILAGIGGSNYLTSLKRGNDGKRVADLNNLRNALEMYYLDQSPHHYPDTSGDWLVVGAGADEALGELIPDYAKQLPSDPKDGQRYYYSSDGNCYCLSAKMEIDGNYRTSIGNCFCPPEHTGECYLVTCP